MADMMNCPVCGIENPQDRDFCRNCNSPLHLSSADDATIQSGQAPTKKVTSELEPVLPQWLRDARNASRDPEQQGTPESMGQPDKTKPIPSHDLLAGLNSQEDHGEEEEYVPDWLASITGTPSKPKAESKTEPIEPSEPSGVRWVEIGGKNDFPQQQEPADDVPSWLSGLQSAEAQPQKDELTDWFSQVEAEKPQLGVQPPAQQPAFDSPLPGFQADETPDWLRSMAQEAEPTEEAKPAETPLDMDVPSWFNSLGGAEEPAQGDEPTLFTESTPAESDAFEFPSDMPAWLKSDAEEKPSSKQDTTPPWLKEKSSESSAPEMPAWLAENEGTVRLPSEPTQAEEPGQDILADLPDWLKTAGPLSSLFTPQEETPAEEPAQTLSAESSDENPVFTPGALESAPAFTPDAAEPIDELFTDMPDWLSNAIEPAPDVSSASKLTPITNEDALAPSDLPSWVQAMRPVEPDLSPVSLASDQTLESRGALAGLQGVLPSVPGFTPTSKPKAYSIKLDANAEQLKHAEILEQILAAEAAPEPVASYASLRTSRSLRWFLAAVLVLGILVMQILPTQIFSLPIGAPAEVLVIRDTLFGANPIPQNAPVLVAFDYESSRAAEMELAANRMMDLLILISHPNFTFISTNETGSILAERFISQPKFVDHFKNGGFSYSNLGYLPGGQLGIRAFAQDPKGVSPFDINGGSAWTAETYANFENISQFAAMVLITDNAESARVWVEQTQDVRGALPIFVVSSAQAAPMIEPYYDSGQVRGIIPGLYGGTVFEQFNQDLPGVAKVHWDAYSLGMLLAMMFVLGGGLWNLVLGLRERAAAREAK